MQGENSLAKKLCLLSLHIKTSLSDACPLGLHRYFRGRGIVILVDSEQTKRYTGNILKLINFLPTSLPLSSVKFPLFKVKFIILKNTLKINKSIC